MSPGKAGFVTAEWRCKKKGQKWILGRMGWDNGMGWDELGQLSPGCWHWGDTAATLPWHCWGGSAVLRELLHPPG